VVLTLKNLLFTIIVPGTVGVYVPRWIASDRPVASGPAFLAATFLLVVGSGIYARCVWDFATFGRGTPAPVDAPRRLVVRGLYRYVRNPMYVGVLTVIFGLAMLYADRDIAVYGLLVGIAFHLFVVLYEEPALRGAFGHEYERYVSRVPRWIPTRRPDVDT